MVLNYIWIAFFLIAFIVAVVKLIFFADFTVFPAIMQSTFDTSKQGFEISLGLTGVLSLWLGIMKVGEKGGVVNALARLLGPIFARLFPDVPKGHPVVGNIFMNLAANMLGLDNAATPLGLKAMEGLQELNAKKDTASNPMIMFLVLNTSGLTLIPVSIMTYRFQRRPAYGSFCAYSARDIRIYACGYHHYVALSAHQSLQSYALADAWRNVAFYGFDCLDF